MRHCAACTAAWSARSGVTREPTTLIVAGWAMDNMKPRSVILSVQPLIAFPVDREFLLNAMISGADRVGVALRGMLKPVPGGGRGPRGRA